MDRDRRRHAPKYPETCETKKKAPITRLVLDWSAYRQDIDIYMSVLIVWRPPLGRYTQSDGCSDLGSGRCCGIYLLRGHWHFI